MKRFTVGTGLMVLAGGLLLSPASIMAADVSAHGAAGKPASNTSRTDSAHPGSLPRSSRDFRLPSGTPLRSTMDTKWKEHEPAEGQQPRSGRH